jgi:hypothetical protein
MSKTKTYPQWVVIVNPGQADEITDGAFHRYSEAADRRDTLTRDGEEADIAQQDNDGNLTWDF